MGEVSVVDYPIGDPNSLRNSIPNFFIDNKQPNWAPILFLLHFR